MPNYKIADIRFSYSFGSQELAERLLPYQCADSFAGIDLTLNESDTLDQRNYLTSGVLCEGVALCRKFSDRLTERFGGVLFHSAAVCVGRRAFLFAAPSGVGKTTHLRLLRARYGDRVRVINGDKPILRAVDDRMMVYGSPWQGKENDGENISALLAAVFILCRAQENDCRRISCYEALPFLVRQAAMPDSRNGKRGAMEFLDKMAAAADFFLLGAI